MTVYLVPKRVACVVADTEANLPKAVFLMQLPDGSPHVLQGSAAWIWLLATEGEPDVAGAVARVVGLTKQEVAADVEDFLYDLVSRGLLEVEGSLR